MKLADNKATLSFSNGSPSIELPVYQGSVGPDVVDIRKLICSWRRLKEVVDNRAHSLAMTLPEFCVHDECKEGTAAIRHGLVRPVAVAPIDSGVRKPETPKR